MCRHRCYLAFEGLHLSIMALPFAEMQSPPWMDGLDPADKLNVFLLNTARLTLLGTPSFMRTLLHMVMACIHTGLQRPVTCQWVALGLNPSGSMMPCDKVFKVVTVRHPTFPPSLSLSLEAPLHRQVHPCQSWSFHPHIRASPSTILRIQGSSSRA